MRGDGQQAGLRGAARAALLVVLALFAPGLFMPAPGALAQQGEALATFILDGAAPAREAAGRVAYFLDETQAMTLDEARAAAAAGAFRPYEGEEPDFGFTDAAIWLRFEAVNASGRRLENRLVFGANFMPAFAVYKIASSGQEAGQDGEPQAGEVETLLDQSRHTPFAERPEPFPDLVAPFVMEAGERASVYVRYRSYGGTTLPVRFETLQSFSAWSQARTAKLFLFYSVMLVFTAISLVAFAASPRAIFAAYTVYAASVLLYIAHLDGALFQYVWPDAPWWNSVASLPLGASVGLTAAVFARIFLDTRRRYPFADKILLVVIAGCALLPALAFVVGERGAKQFAAYWIAGGAASFLLIGLHVLRRTRHLRNLFYVLGWLGIVVGTFLGIAYDLFGLSPIRNDTLDIVRVAMVFDAVMMGLAVAAGIFDLRAERDRSLKERLRGLELNLSLHERLNDVERRYAVAADEAEQRGRALADASHDIRQPLFALRSALRKAERRGRPSREAGELAYSLDYIEALVEDFLGRAMDEAPGAGAETGLATPAAMILNAAGDMFAGEAAAKGLAFSVAPSTKEVAAEALPLLRIVNNFAANAVAYCERGKVLIGCRRRAGRLVFEVWDTGPGLSRGEVERLTRRGARGEGEANPAGRGLGLAIAGDLAERHGLEIAVDSRPGRGSRFSVSAPLA